MKKSLLFLFFMVSLAASAQFDRGNTILIPPVDNPVDIPLTVPDPAPEAPKKDPRAVPSSIFDNSVENKSLVIENSVDFSRPKPNFVNPGDAVAKKLNKRGDGEMFKVIRQNQYLGDFRTSASKVSVAYRDSEYVDGDQIKVWVNDKVYKEIIYLDGSFQGFKLELQPGFNKIDFEALNQGTSGPNTAQFQVYDDQGKLISSNRWDLATGFKATIIIVKE